MDKPSLNGSYDDVGTIVGTIRKPNSTTFPGRARCVRHSQASADPAGQFDNQRVAGEFPASSKRKRRLRWEKGQDQTNLLQISQKRLE
jgi:hypothetical protein